MGGVWGRGRGAGGGGRPRTDSGRSGAALREPVEDDMTRVLVRVDQRLRLAGCLLAAGDWPEREQSGKPYRPHRLGEGARRALAAQRTHAGGAATRGLEG